MGQLEELKLFARTARFPVSVLRGSVGDGAGELSILYGGSKSEKAYLARRAFDQPPAETALGKRWLTGTSGLALAHGCDLEIIGVPRGDVVAGMLGGYFAIPSWVSGDVMLSDAAFKEGDTRSRRRDLRLIERNGFRYEVTRDAADLGFFYDEMYRPTMEASHGSGALLMARDHMNERLQQGECELVKILREDEFVAGSLIVYDAGEPRLWSEGIRGASDELLKLGATAAIYFLSFQHLLRKGYRRVDVGRSRAFLSDGALYYKRRFGLELRRCLTGRCSTGRYFLMVRRRSAASDAFLAQNPFIISAGKELHGVGFVKTGELSSGADWQRVVKDLLIPGVSRLRICLLNGERADDIEIPAELSDRVELGALDALVSPSAL